MTMVLRKRQAKEPQAEKPPSKKSKLSTPQSSQAKSTKSKPTKSTPTKEQKTRKTSFLDLPPEIRNMIYDLVFQVPPFVCPMVTGPIKPERFWNLPVTTAPASGALDLWPSCIRTGGYHCKTMWRGPLPWQFNEEEPCYVQDNNPPIIIPSNLRPPIDHEFDCRPYHIHLSQHGKLLSGWRPGEMGMASLHRTCRQIRMETIGLLYSRSTFTFIDTHHLHHFLLTIGDFARQHILEVFFNLFKMPRLDDESLPFLGEICNVWSISFGVTRKVWAHDSRPGFLIPMKHAQERTLLETEDVSASETIVMEAGIPNQKPCPTLPPTFHLLSEHQRVWYEQHYNYYGHSNVIVTMEKHDDSKPWPADIVNDLWEIRNTPQVVLRPVGFR